MKPQMLPYRVPPAWQERPTLPAWRDLLYTWPGTMAGLLGGSAVSLLYLARLNIVWLAVILLGAKLALGFVLTQSDRFHWVGLGVLLSIVFGFLVFASAVLSYLPVC